MSKLERFAGFSIGALVAGVTERDVHAHRYVDRVEKTAAAKAAAKKAIEKAQAAAGVF